VAADTPIYKCVYNHTTKEMMPPAYRLVSQASSAEQLKANSNDLEDEDTELTAEEIARQFNLSKGLSPDNELLEDVGPNGEGTEGLTPDGEWRIDQPLSPRDPSNLREAVSLPVQFRVYYDWAVGEGWSRGDGSFTAFVVDCLFNHFTECWKKRILIGDVDELGLASNIQPIPIALDVA